MRKYPSLVSFHFDLMVFSVSLPSSGEAMLEGGRDGWMDGWMNAVRG